MDIYDLPTDLNKLWHSYLPLNTVDYYNNNWTKYNVETVCNVAAEHGFIDLLTWSRLKGYPWSTETCAIASLNGQLEILKLLHEYECPWDMTTRDNAEKGLHDNIISWLNENKYLPVSYYHNHIQIGNNYVSNGLCTYSFALTPEQHMPTGSCNLSRIDHVAGYKIFI